MLTSGTDCTGPRPDGPAIESAPLPPTLLPPPPPPLPLVLVLLPAGVGLASLLDNEVAVCVREDGGRLPLLLGRSTIPTLLRDGDRFVRSDGIAAEEEDDAVATLAADADGAVDVLDEELTGGTTTDCEVDDC